MVCQLDTFLTISVIILGSHRHWEKVKNFKEDDNILILVNFKNLFKAVIEEQEFLPFWHNRLLLFKVIRLSHQGQNCGHLGVLIE